MLPKFIDGDRSGLNNLNRIYLVLVSGKLVLRKNIDMRMRNNISAFFIQVSQQCSLLPCHLICIVVGIVLCNPAFNFIYERSTNRSFTTLLSYSVPEQTVAISGA